jgi:DNA repair exonuclease SbcCD ATPase subunit
MKTSKNMTTYLLYSFLFAIILFCTFDLVNYSFENYEQYDVEVKGVNNLVDLLKLPFSGDDSKKIDINNHMGGTDSSNENAQCWNALGKHQKELEIIKYQLDSYSGTDDSIDKLNTQLNTLMDEASNLENEIKKYEGTNKEIDNIQKQIRKYEDEIFNLKEKIKLYNKTNDSINDINDSISAVQSRISTLLIDIDNCESLNSLKEGEEKDILNDIRDIQEPTIKSLRDTIRRKRYCR